MNSLPFSKKEYRQRLEKIRGRMSEQGLDALILTRAQNIYYVSGYRAAVMNWTLPLLALVVPIKGEMRFMTRLIESATADTQLAPDPRKYKDHENPYALLAELLEETGYASGRIVSKRASSAPFSSAKSGKPCQRKTAGCELAC